MLSFGPKHLDLPLAILGFVKLASMICSVPGDDPPLLAFAIVLATPDVHLAAL